MAIVVLLPNPSVDPVRQWPVGLPRPTTDGYSLTPIDQTISSDMEVGSPRVRRRTRARNDTVAASWDFTDTQLELFRNWFDDPMGAAGGSAFFTVDLAIGTGGVRPVSARFKGGTLKVAHMGGLQWRASAELLVR